MRIEKMKCNLCGGARFKFMFQKNDYSIIRCKSCGLVTVSPFPTEHDLNELYEKEYFESGSNKVGYSKYKKGINNYIDYVTKQPFIKKRIDYLGKFSKGGKLLDVGCAHGFFMDKARKKWDVMGVDISKYACDFGKTKLKLNILNKTLEDAAFPDNYFDVVTIWSFLDHCTDPLKLFQEIHRILKVGGVLAFNISNVDSFRAIVNNENWRPIRPPEHLYYYSINTVNRYLSKTGFGKTTYFGKNEIGIRHVLQNPDLSMDGKKVKFRFSFLESLKVSFWGALCYLSLKTKINNYTIGSNLEVFTRKIK
ncbi:class I SAM-dependent methyltransferase [Candidatus Woesearchaeota archaeon]|nr:class I SAM-dependent methyltransferase [Candidatus Woesearchaeota archaeon]